MAQARTVVLAFNGAKRQGYAMVSSFRACGAVAVVAVAAGSMAQASVTVDFNGVTVPTGSFVQLSPTTYGGFAWGGDLEVFDQTYWQANYGGNTSGFTGNLAYGGNDAPFPSFPITATWAGAGSISLDGLNIGSIWATIGGNASTSVIVKGFKNNSEVAAQTITLTSSVQAVTFSGGFGDIDMFSFEVGSGGGFFYFDSFSYSVVPAPGAMALLGVAGLAGSRRRR